MRDAIIIFVAIILAITIGGYLLLNGTPSKPPGLPSPDDFGLSGDEPFLVLAEGQNAGSFTKRTNYRITTEEQFIEFWNMLYGQDSVESVTRPNVDFSRYEVIAVFDGSHSTGGFDVSVTDITDGEGKRTVQILRTSPGDTCITTQGFTSPFEIVRVIKTDLPIERQETARVSECS